jgi:copper chaperone
MESITLKTPGITCSHCEAAIKKAVGGLTGAGTVDVDLATKLVTVVYDGGSLNPVDIKTAIEAQGYDVIAP